MPSGFFLLLSITCISIAIGLFIKNFRLYKNAVKSFGKVIKVEEYSYASYAYEGPVVTETFYVPIIEVEIDLKNSVTISYNSMSSEKHYKVGDKIEVIYPKNRTEYLRINTKYIYIEESMAFMVLSIVFLILALVLPII